VIYYSNDIRHRENRMTPNGQAADVSVWMLPSRGWSVRLPQGWHLGECRFERRAECLVLSDERGRQVVLRDYYACDAPPDLRDETGQRLPGELARLMAGLSVKAQELVLVDGFGSRRTGT
jgi:hypothetical protein